MSDISPYRIYQAELTADTNHNAGWLQTLPYRNVCVSFLITTELTGTLDNTTLTLYGSASSDEENEGVQIGSYTTTPSATGEILWLAHVPALPYIRVEYVAGDCSGGAATLTVTRC